jgi:hypothetical protein
VKSRVAICVLSTILLVIALQAKASGCSCIERSPCEAFGYASAVFIGSVVGGTEKVREFTRDGKTSSSEAGQVRFNVEESFKGITGTEITITVLSMKGTSCGDYGLERGQRYLVYASSSQTGALTDGPCSRTRTVEDAREDLEFLHNLPRQGTGGRLSGHVGVDFGGRENPPLPQARVTISNELQRYEAVTNANGDYELVGLAAGKYRVILTLPKGYVCNTAERELLVTDRGCAKESFWTKVDKQPPAASQNPKP